MIITWQLFVVQNHKTCSISTEDNVPQNITPTFHINSKYECHSIDKLQNGIILSIFETERYCANSFVYGKQENCFLWDAFNSNVAIFNVYI